ncbi:tRNA pseudouridine55 synthase [Ruminococcus sp. YE71]|uniref:tRNA pseudouridine(55) synthase TruB n=1 Tax=unclassified Ruminococcus TaxID=2608920 RepID=UPI00088EB0C6|nr:MULTISPECIES: tRNA pseudouridine(55) synthase TruB [unclassified Ruminococcus]SDA22852.1 tRNA pseudouridine55 synthase [Ruminococcus sp. YE78]SFW38900.1 tRNA pseudouridine55 synthase [Ruminococcus sp. YE71]
MADIKNEPIGILAVNKPEGWTSFDVVGKLRGVLHMKRLGHGGTLDPMATGVLPVLVGKATKCFGIMPDSGKSYIAGFRLGITTDTQDTTGETLGTSDMAVTRADIEARLPSLTGDIMQLPPMYSAVKVGGKKLYELAREGKTVERQARPVHIDRLTLTDYDEQTREGRLEIDCGSGTYVRTVIDDLGQALGCGGAMTSLVRTRSNGLTLEKCRTIEEIAELCAEGIPEGLLCPVDSVFSPYPVIRLGERETALYKNGVKLGTHQVQMSETAEIYRIYGFDGVLLGLGGFVDGGLRRKTNFY